MRCLPDRTIFSELPRGYTLVGPRIGDLLFSGDDADLSIWANPLTVFGDLEGRATVSPHFSRDALTPSARGTRPWSEDPIVVSRLVQWRPDRSPERIPGHEGDIWGLKAPLLIGRSGEGTFLRDAGDLVLWGERPPRSFPRRATGLPTGAGVFQDEPGDEVVVAMVYGLARGATLIRASGKLPMQERTFAFRALERAPDEEIAIGLGHGETGP